MTPYPFMRLGGGDKVSVCEIHAASSPGYLKSSYLAGIQKGCDDTCFVDLDFGVCC